MFNFVLLSSYGMALAILGWPLIRWVSLLWPSAQTKEDSADLCTGKYVTATGAGGYQEKWVRSESSARKVGGDVSSGDEQSTVL